MTAERLCQFQATDNPSAGAIQSDVVPRILRGNIVEFHGKKTMAIIYLRNQVGRIRV